MKNLICFVLLAICGNLSAATFCVATSDQLQNALNSAQSNNQSDEIRIRTGTFVALGTGFTFVAAASDLTDGLTLSGGWTGASNACTARNRSPGASVLSGGGVRRILYVENYSSLDPNLIAIDTLTFKDGDATAIAGDAASRASLVVKQLAAGSTIRIENCIFRDNQANSSLAGPSIQGGGAIYFRNNLIANNQVLSNAHTSLEVGGSGTAYVQNNTFVNNGAISFQNLSGFHIRLFNGANAYVENNIVWGSYGGAPILGHSLGIYFDEINGSNGYTVRNNNIDQAFQLPASAVGTTSVNPMFADAVNFELDGASPMVGAGVNDVHAASGLGSYDLIGRSRLIGTTVDLGASESAVAIFGNGME